MIILCIPRSPVPQHSPGRKAPCDINAALAIIDERQGFSFGTSDRGDPSLAIVAAVGTLYGVDPP